MGVLKKKMCKIGFRCNITKYRQRIYLKIED